MTSIIEIKSLLEQNNLSVNKALGQNFLIDPNIIAKTISAASITPNYGVIEIGAGLGAITFALANAAKHVVSIEYDRGLFELLTERGLPPNVTLIHADALKADFAGLIAQHMPDMPIVCAANLPYYITTPLLFRLLEEGLPLESITVMIQREVAGRIVAKANTPNYGALSLAVEYYAEPRIVSIVPPTCFYPRPNVDSCIINLTIKDTTKKELSHNEEKLLFTLIRAAFMQRRKTLVNAICGSGAFNVSKDIITQAVSQSLNDLRVRGEALSLKDYVELTKMLCKFL